MPVSPVVLGAYAVAHIQFSESPHYTGPKVLKTADAADYLGVGKSTLEKWRIYGRGPAFVKYGSRTVRYFIEDLDFFSAHNRKLSVE